jgi:hypothetical protein
MDWDGSIRKLFHKSTEEMDPETIEPGAPVQIRPVVLPNGVPVEQWRLVYVVSTHDHRTYMLYDTEDATFIEMTRDAAEFTGLGLGYRSVEISRWNWMKAYVTALDTGSTELQGVVEAHLRNSKTLGGYTFSGENTLAITTRDGKTLLHIAASLQRYKAVQWLLDEDKRVNEKVDWVNKVDNWDGDTALGVACRNNRLDICKLLLEHGADPNTVYYAPDDELKILQLYGGERKRISGGVRKPSTKYVLTRVLCSVAPISRLPTDILWTHVLPML